MSLSTFDENPGISPNLILNNASGTTLHELFPYNARQHRFDAIYASNLDSIVHVLRLWLNHGGTLTLLGSVSLAAGQGTGGTPALELLGLILGTGQTGLVLDETSNVQLALEVAATGATAVHVSGQGGYV